MWDGYTGTIYLNNSIAVDGNGSDLDTGTIDMGDWQDGQTLRSGGNLYFQNASAPLFSVFWSGTTFFFTNNGSDNPGTIFVDRGAWMRVDGPTRLMGVSLVIGDPDDTLASNVTVTNMTGDVQLGALAKIKVQKNGELHLDSYSDNTGNLVKLGPAPSINIPLVNRGLIERTGQGTESLQVQIVNDAPTSILRVNSGTLSVGHPIFAADSAVVQSDGKTVLDGNNNPVLKVNGTGYKMTGGSFTATGPYLTTLDGDFTMTEGTATVQFTRFTGKFKITGGAFNLIQDANSAISQGFEQDGGGTALASNATLNMTGVLAETGGAFTFGDFMGGANLSATDGVQVGAGARAIAH